MQPRVIIQTWEIWAKSKCSLAMRTLKKEKQHTYNMYLFIIIVHIHCLKINAYIYPKNSFIYYFTWSNHLQWMMSAQNKSTSFLDDNDGRMSCMTCTVHEFSKRNIELETTATFSGPKSSKILGTGQMLLKWRKHCRWNDQVGMESELKAYVNTWHELLNKNKSLACCVSNKGPATKNNQSPTRNQRKEMATKFVLK